MTPQAVSNEEIDAIFEYIEGWEDKTPPPPPTGGSDPTGSGEGSSNMIWWIIGVLLVIVMFAVGGVKKELKNVSLEQDGKERTKDLGLGGSIRGYLWKNFNYAFFFGYVIVIVGLVFFFKFLPPIFICKIQHRFTK